MLRFVLIMNFVYTFGVLNYNAKRKSMAMSFIDLRMG